MRITEKLPFRSTQRLPTVGFVVLGFAAVVNLGALSIAETSFRQLQVASTAVARADQVVAAIERLRLQLLEAETGERGYLITGDAAYLQPYRRAQQRFGADLVRLEELVAGEPVQQTQLLTVRRLVSERMEQAATTIEARRIGGLAEAVPLVMTHAGKLTMDTLQAALDGMENQELVARAAPNASLARDRQVIRIGIFAEAALNVVLVTMGAFSLWREVDRRKRDHAALAERGATLEAEVRERTAQLSALSRFQEDVREDEKKRVARELHDELGGTLTAAKIDLQLISDRLKADAVVGPRLTRINAALDDAIAVKRRIIEDLRPTLLDNLGICAALRWQCEEFAKRTGCACSTHCPEGDEQPSLEQSVALYRIVQEALTNIAKHAQANRVDVDLRLTGDRWRLAVRDDGVGFDPEKERRPTAHGLVSIRERVLGLGGEVLVSGAPGAGTTIEVVLPAAASIAAAG